MKVAFSLPDGWTVASSWNRAGSEWAPGVANRYRVEDLIASSVGVGRFRRHEFEANGTRYLIATEVGIPATQELAIATTLEEASRFIASRWGRRIGKRYVTVVLPRSHEGDEIIGESWATGQGGTLTPATVTRVRDFAKGLIAAHIRHEPYRSEISRRAEFWLVDAITGLYSWRAAAQACSVRADDVVRSFAGQYVDALTSPDLEQDLERLYSSACPHRPSLEVLAPLVLLLLDQEVQHTTGRKQTLDSVLLRVFRGRKATSLWKELPNAKDSRWESFRTKFVRGAERVPLARLLKEESTEALPEPAPGPPTSTLTIVLTGKTHGYLENCGCKVNQSGGVARRVSTIRDIRASDPEALLFDAGGTFPKSSTDHGDRDFLSRLEEDLFLDITRGMDYDALGLGETEFAHGLRHFRDKVAGTRLPYLAANVRDGGAPLLPPTTVVMSHGVRIGVVGIFEPPVEYESRGRLAETLASLSIEDPVVAVQRVFSEIRRTTDIVLLLGRIRPSTIRRLVSAFPDVGVIVSSENEMPKEVSIAGSTRIARTDRSGFLGRTLVLYSSLQNYGLEVARIGLDRNHRIASADIEGHWLRKDVRDDPTIRRKLNQFYDRVGRLSASQTSVPPLFAGDSARLTRRYVGVQGCKECHMDEYEQWESTKHAGAYKTLLEVHRHFQPRCVVCHVVGFGTRHGYVLGAPEENLGNVQCEVCHGPGDHHVSDPSASNIRREVPRAICVECHNPDHSDDFVYDQKLPRVRHDLAWKGPSSNHE